MLIRTWCMVAIVLSRRPSVVGSRQTRPSSAFAAAALCGLLSGCRAGEPPLVNPGVSDVKPELASARRPTADAGASWERASEATSYRALAKEPFSSLGHFAGRWTAELFANDAAASLYATLAKSTVMPEGAVLVERLRDRSGAAGPTFVMEKRAFGYFPAGGDWKYLAIDARGNVEDMGQLPLCARCHAEGTADFLFDLPADARP